MPGIKHERALLWGDLCDRECDLLHRGGGVHCRIDLDCRGDEGDCGDRAGGEGADHGGGEVYDWSGEGEFWVDEGGGEQADHGGEGGLESRA